MSVNDAPENVPPTLEDAPEAEPLDGRDSQPVPEGSSDDPRTLEADDPLRDPELLVDEDGPLPEPLPEDEVEELREGAPGESYEEDSLPDGSGNDAAREKQPDPDRFDAG
ncbi:hypothetical protein [Arthrobacter sp. KK5.5]|uniref:hypothetical protein n=1 Tax=Arthrobacter sp. KK5.5 TaxID=3373084 RepID=UPI003EE4CB5B